MSEKEGLVGVYGSVPDCIDRFDYVCTNVMGTMS